MESIWNPAIVYLAYGDGWHKKQANILEVQGIPFAFFLNKEDNDLYLHMADIYTGTTFQKQLVFNSGISSRRNIEKLNAYKALMDKTISILNEQTTEEWLELMLRRRAILENQFGLKPLIVFEPIETT